ncbi:sulfotransferase [Micromonospora sp. WMMA2032]|uniref:Sulfotransferase domain-containing protein n=1 Tax=Micromonospora sediminicola TaxID=946078 RepID=A0A1A9B3N4_9ACTN|nr:MULTISPECIES: sulfotransferase domain-containing protein [Micromonospora]ATO15903.1 sulfotransferase [Micromonospora sp. WMMA2032]PGH41789.1 sulfotransferase [Micromonospora sp. WMMA1996]SBT63639.1 Sulfotransferase domain-containing protein [Micromonospora sediminicola]
MTLAKAKARRAVRSVTRTVGRWTANSRMTPDFLIVGAQRCGTTSLFKTLSQHPGVLPAVYHKGVHYFDTGYDRGMDWYLGHFPTNRRAEAVRAQLGVRGVTGESSPYYMFHPLAGERIAADLPEVRLLVLLRDPVERAYSAHAHESARGFESETFERALELEQSRIAGERERLLADPTAHSHHYQHNAYLTRGQYVEQLERLESIFGRDRLHVIDADDFFADPRPAFDGVCDFLGLPHWADISFGKHNSRSRSAMDPELRARLEAHFTPYDERLAAWWGRVPSWRR